MKIIVRRPSKMLELYERIDAWGKFSVNVSVFGGRVEVEVDAHETMAPLSVRIN